MTQNRQASAELPFVEPGYSDMDTKAYWYRKKSKQRGKSGCRPPVQGTESTVKESQSIPEESGDTRPELVRRRNINDALHETLGNNRVEKHSLSESLVVDVSGKKDSSKSPLSHDKNPQSVPVLQWTNEQLGELTVELKEENIIGSGGQGIVYRANGTACSDREVVVKVLNEDCKILEQEKIKGLRHPFVMPVLDICPKQTQNNSSSKDFIAYPLMKKRSLFGHVVTSDDPLPYKERIRITSNCADGLAYLHENRFVFRDVKSPNILLDELNNPRFGDYGLVKEVTERCLTGTSRIASTYSSSSLSSPQVKSYQYVKGTPGWVCPIYSATHVLDQRCDLWGFGMVMLQLLTGEPIFDSSERENDPRPICVRLGIHEMLDDKSKALKVIFGNKETVAKIRNAGWPAVEDNEVSKTFAELALRCLSMSSYSNRIPLNDLRNGLKKLMKEEGIKEHYNIPDDRYCIYCLCRTRDKVKLTCGHQIACKDCLQDNEYLYCPFHDKQCSAIGHPGVFSLIIASKGQSPSEENTESDDVFVMSGPEVASGLRKSLHFREGNVFCLPARSEKKATLKDAKFAMDQLANKVKEVRQGHNNLEITIILFLLGHFQKGGEFELNDGVLTCCETAKKLKEITPENVLVFANGPGAECFHQRLQVLRHEADTAAAQPPVAGNARGLEDDDQERLVNDSTRKKWISNAIALVTWSWSWIRSWFSPEQEDEDEDDGKQRVGPKEKTIGGFKNVTLLYSDAGEKKSETCVHSYLTDLLLYALEGVQAGCPLKRQRNEKGMCDKCNTYRDAIKEQGVITSGEFINYVYTHPTLNENGAKWGRSDDRNDAAGKMAELQLAYG